jgi:gamma-glutamylcyclotransferase (GGCT)/AIG2-like uncharacterized protein YtfP
MTIFNLFVYGTLKSGFRNHAHYIPQGTKIAEASVIGNLYDSGHGFPILVIPPQNIIQIGSGDILGDGTLAAFPAGVLEPCEGYGLVWGELMLLTEPEKIIPNMDKLEGFRPGQSSFYQRVLTKVTAGAEIVLAWVYINNDQTKNKSVPSGIWTKI